MEVGKQLMVSRLLLRMTYKSGDGEKELYEIHGLIPILQMRKVRPQDDKALGQSHIIVESGMCPRSASSKTRGSYQLAKSQWMYFGNNCLRICSKLHQFLLCRDALFSNPKVSLGRTLGSTVLASSQYSCLEKTMDRVAWRPTVHGVAKSRTQLSD